MGNYRITRKLQLFNVSG